MDHLEVKSAIDLWAWLERNHSSSDSILLVTWKAAHQDKYVSREEVLDALIAYGWIDGRRFAVDDNRTSQLISPRKQQAWSKSYKDRVERLRSEGKMKPAGEAAVEAGQASGLWEFYAEVDALTVPVDLAASIDIGKWQSFPPSYQRNVLRWLHLAKTEETREKRIIEIAHATSMEERLPQM
ncbi:hypothetical protein RA28_00760 [Ruegeria sp. ANG-S4]|uniref:YdeI/OmpD-associated family protein n=1 Tax=Ruegeria sp. ANG-S4 TaxID=1577904 RepID=UPI00057CD71C|nr:YdeI/OmpD-associated family protein [Ruegeria sp. ANG-S4]KIC46371.1 hypothetical protein RA28_00760 [Ruegeria sp. ANG-S4]